MHHIPYDRFALSENCLLYDGSKLTELSDDESEIIYENDYKRAMNRTHRSIGFAMYYTSVTIMVGFSILVFSNFIPSIYFGMLTSMAMFIALFSSLVLLPQILILLKPFKSSRNVKTT